MVGCGPWSPPVLVLPASGTSPGLVVLDRVTQTDWFPVGPSVQVPVQRSHMWVGLLLGLLVATVVGLLLAVATRRRGKEMHFRYEEAWLVQPSQA